MSKANPSNLELIKWLTSITKKVHPPLYLSALCRILNLLSEMLIFAFLGFFAVSIFIDSGDKDQLYKALFIFVIVAIFKGIVAYFEQFLGHYVAFKSLEILRQYTFSRLWRNGIAVVMDKRSGDILTSVTKDIDRIEVVYAHTFAPVISALIVPFGTLFALAVTFWTTGLADAIKILIIPFICVFLGVFVVPFIGAKSAFRATQETIKTRRELSAHLTDSIYGLEEVIIYHGEEKRISESEQLGSSIADNADKASFMVALRRGLMVALSLISTASIIFMMRAEILPDFVLVLLAAGSLRLFEGPIGVEAALGYLDYAFSAARRLYELCHLEERVTGGEKIFAPTRAPSIRWDNVSYTYKDMPRPALRDINLSVKPGEHVVFKGHSGSGKTTTTQLLLRFDDPSSGQILVDGTPIEEFTLESLRRHIGLVQQHSLVLDGTIAENIRLAKADASDDEIFEALETACLLDEVFQMPDGIEAQVGKNGENLSGGQLQRLCLARVLVMKPSVLILDEFAANLNISLEEKIREQIRSLPNVMTIIEIAHRESNLANLDQELIFDMGSVVAK